MRSRILQLSELILRELLSRPRLTRRPEPALVMEAGNSVEAFHAEGSATGALVPIYQFNALALSQLLPKEGSLVDLGSGSGQFLGYLADCRPDVHILGLDLSQPMVETGKQTLRQFGDRISLRVGDMTRFQNVISGPVDAISSVFALHHLQGLDELQRCLSEIAQVRSRSGCGVWIFDHVRPRHPRTLEAFPAVFTPQAAEEFQRDSRNSLEASFSFSELSSQLDKTLPGLTHACSRLLRLYQVHWSAGTRQPLHGGHSQWVEPSLTGEGRREFHEFLHLFRKENLPID